MVKHKIKSIDLNLDMLRKALEQFIEKLKSKAQSKQTHKILLLYSDFRTFSRLFDCPKRQLSLKKFILEFYKKLERF